MARRSGPSPIATRSRASAALPTGLACPAATTHTSSAAASCAPADRRTVTPAPASAFSSSPSAHRAGADEAIGSDGSAISATRRAPAARNARAGTRADAPPISPVCRNVRRFMPKSGPHCSHIILNMRQFVFVLAFAGLSIAGAAAQTAPYEQRARAIYKELIEINTTDTPAGNVTTAAQAMAARLKAAGFPDADVQVLGPDPTQAQPGRAVSRHRRAPSSPAPRPPRRRRGQARGLVRRSLHLPRARRLVLRPRDPRRQGDGLAVCRQPDPPQGGRVQA